MRNVSRGLFIGAILLTLAGLAQAQSKGAPAPSTPTAPTTTTPSPNTPTTVPGLPRGNTTPTPNTPTTPPRPIFVSGRVILHDGGDLPDRATIERLCSTNSVRAEGYTDSKGYFAFQIGANTQTMPDASTPFSFDPTTGNATSSNNNNNTGPSNSDNPYADCELRARLPGFRSTTSLLAGRKSMDNPDVGSIVLYPIGAVEGRAVSLTNASAPKNAKKALENGLNAVKKNKKDDAEKEFRAAVAIYPKYAEAWTELGKLLIGRRQFVPAREALEQAVAADPRYVLPHEQLYILAFEEAKWQELADTTERLLRLNPYDFMGAFYFNGVANYQLNHLDEAEKSLKEALGMDFRNANPKAHYVLGLVLLKQNNVTEAKEHLGTFMKLAPEDAMIAKVKNILFQLDQAPLAQAAPLAAEQR